MIVLRMPFALNLHTIEIASYLGNAEGLRAGAPVRLRGVDIGKVTRVRVRPEMKDNPVEVLMRLGTSYELRIPADSVVTLSTAGVLGETYVDIDAAAASGPPIGNHGVLKSRTVVSQTPEQFLKMFGDILRRPCDCERKETPRVSKKSRSTSSPQ